MRYPARLLGKLGYRSLCTVVARCCSPSKIPIVDVPKARTGMAAAIPVRKVRRLMIYIQDDCIAVNDGTIAVCGTRGWICPGDFHYQEEKDAKPYRRELLRVERILQKADTLGCQTKLLLLHYPPVCDLVKPSGFTDLLEQYNVPLCVFGHLHGMPYPS